ncbi:MAG TPA: hypothetical protein VK579_17625 [Terriglobales bacterium]|nr:hypothetical protein [Terriglobales bacterium]
MDRTAESAALFPLDRLVDQVCEVVSRHAQEEAESDKHRITKTVTQKVYKCERPSWATRG